MGRADFFKYIFGKTAQAAADITENMIKPLHEANLIAQKVVTQPLLAVAEYSGEPSMVMSSKPPVYVVGEIDKNLTAFGALCKNDGFLLRYLPHEQALFCSACGAKHRLELKEDRIESDLETYPVAVKEDKICLLRAG